MSLYEKLTKEVCLCNNNADYPVLTNWSFVVTTSYFIVQFTPTYIVLFIASTSNATLL